MLSGIAVGNSYHRLNYNEYLIRRQEKKPQNQIIANTSELPGSKFLRRISSSEISGRHRTLTEGKVILLHTFGAIKKFSY